MMKRHFVVILLLLISLSHAHAQHVMSLMDARAAGITREGMDSLYMSAFNMQDTTLEAFPGQREAFIGQWDSTLTLLKTYLIANGLRFDPEQKMTYRSFFSKDGHMEHFHYLFKPAISEEKAEEFDKLVDSFFSSFVFPIVPDQPFRQCGTTAME